MFSKCKEVLKTLCWPILFGIGQLFICGIMVAIYMAIHSSIDWSTSESTRILNDYINSHTIWISLGECFIFIPLFYFIYKKYRLEKSAYKMKHLVLIIIFSCVLSLGLNGIIILSKHFLNISLNASKVSFSIILATGIIGPILEELLFRGIVYGRFLTIFRSRKALYYSVFVFALFHVGGISQILFALLTGYWLTVVYAKNGNIRLSMLAHITINLTSLLLSPYIVSFLI